MSNRINGNAFWRTKSRLHSDYEDSDVPSRNGGGLEQGIFPENPAIVEPWVAQALTWH